MSEENSTQPQDPPRSRPPPVNDYGVSTAYQQLAQSTVEMMQNTSEHLLELASLSTTASGAALRLMLSGEQPDRAAQALEQARHALEQATHLYDQVGHATLQLLRQLQPPAPPAPPAPAQPPGASSDSATRSSE